jgi:hypothetical protein
MLFVLLDLKKFFILKKYNIKDNKINKLTFYVINYYIVRNFVFP